MSRERSLKAFIPDANSECLAECPFIKICEEDYGFYQQELDHIDVGLMDVSERTYVQHDAELRRVEAQIATEACENGPKHVPRFRLFGELVLKCGSDKVHHNSVHSSYL